MKIQFLGTAAFEGIPGMFCECEVCRRSRELGGKNIRTRSQAIVDDSLLIDFPADTYQHFLRFNIPMSKIKACIVTHSHCDHLYIDDIAIRKRGFSVIKDIEPLHFYADQSTYDMINSIIKRENLIENEVQNHLIKTNTPFMADGYEVTALRATHAPATTPVVYIIEKDGKGLFYVNDTSDFPEESWKYLESYGKKLNLVSFDCTAAWSEIDYKGHMNVQRCMAMRDRLIEIGVADKDTIFVLNHFSHNGEGVVYDDFVKTAAEVGFLASYDGMTVEF